MVIGDLTDPARNVDHEVVRFDDARPGDVDRPRTATDGDAFCKVKALDRHGGSLAGGTT
jgi:hypothetical protein